jgi:hypothetical protein
LGGDLKGEVVSDGRLAFGCAFQNKAPAILAPRGSILRSFVRVAPLVKRDRRGRWCLDLPGFPPGASVDLPRRQPPHRSP